MFAVHMWIYERGKTEKDKEINKIVASLSVSLASQSVARGGVSVL